jgi:phage terminase Nu1 subunit (DNA packaging protein)
MSNSLIKKKSNISHHFLDEAGDTTFFADNKIIIGTPGVSLSFSIGMVNINGDLSKIREQVIALQKQVEQDNYLNVIPSVKKKVAQEGFFFHATDDVPEIRQLFYKFIKTLDCSMEIVVARKEPDRYLKKHNGKENEFYADILSHLIKNKLVKGNKLVLNIASRGNTTGNKTLELALNKATSRAAQKHSSKSMTTEVCFNVQNHITEPLLNIADYMCWSVQRVFERGETRFYDFIKERISVIVDLYDVDKYNNSGNYYGTSRNIYLTALNKISPHSP